MKRVKDLLLTTLVLLNSCGTSNENQYNINALSIDKIIQDEGWGDDLDVASSPELVSIIEEIYVEVIAKPFML